jgi:hypothetical protein
LAALIKAGRRKLSRKNSRKMAPAEMVEFGSAVGKSSAAAAKPRHFRSNYDVFFARRRSRRGSEELTINATRMMKDIERLQERKRSRGG